MQTEPSEIELQNLKRLAAFQRRAMLLLLIFLASLPGFVGLLYLIEATVGLPGDEYAYHILGVFFAVQITLYFVMAVVNYRLGRVLGIGWVVYTCIATIFAPAVALITLFILSQRATRVLKKAGVPVGFFGANPDAIDAQMSFPSISA